jgi:hypothetical protein
VSAVEMERRTTQQVDGLRTAWPQDAGGYSHDPMPSDGPMAPKRDAGHLQQLEAMTARLADVAGKIAGGLQHELDRALGPVAEAGNDVRVAPPSRHGDAPPLYRVRQELERLETGLRAIDLQANRVRAL